ncbi:hypothetical protein P3X46_011143 [Hevea brasiliensis]|uniref:Nucleosome assembly protein n=1 Tax=Hevea brasiliensis TaxID=3981 RepID=A0ABQ9MGA7_HEVBR|nr:hypothetical protein P3X46_011143 [Hevea brasiliensis]
MSNDNKDTFSMSDVDASVPAAAAALSAEDRADLVNALMLSKSEFSAHHEINSNCNLRYEIMNGIKDVEGITNEVATNQEGDKAIEEKGVPDFWLTAMKTNEVVGEERMEIEWYPGKCLTKKVLKKKPQKESKNAKPITKIKNCASFFNFFNTPNIPQEDDDPDDDAVEEIQDRMEQDYNVGTTIRDRVIPHAVSWFTGEAVDDELDVEDDNDNDNDNDDDDDNDIDEDKDEDDNEYDEDEDDDEGKRSRKKLSSGRKKSGGARAGKSQQSERASECKQQ